MPCRRVHGWTDCCEPGLQVRATRMVSRLVFRCYANCRAARASADLAMSMCRVGEAANPGPHAMPQQREGNLDLQYASMSQDGFWGAMLPSGQGHGGEGGGHGDDDDLARYQLVVDTCNGTSWGSIARCLLQTRADLLLVQEHHLSLGQIAAASQWAGRKGWQTVWTSAEQGEGTGWRAGVCICARTPVALSLPRRGGSNVCGARAVAAVAEAPGHRPIAVYSAYLRDGEGLSKGNLQILASIGQHIRLQGDEAPFIWPPTSRWRQKRSPRLGSPTKSELSPLRRATAAAFAEQHGDGQRLTTSPSNTAWRAQWPLWPPLRPPASELTSP